MTRKKILMICTVILAVIAGMVAVMSVSFYHGKTYQTGTGPPAVQEDTKAEIDDRQGSGRETISNDEALSKITGEDDDFTLVADPANFDVEITGYDGTAWELATPVDVLHDQLKAWMDENEFWDMTEVIYTGQYMRDDVNDTTTLYFIITRYPNSPLIAMWDAESGLYTFSIEWH